MRREIDSFSKIADDFLAHDANTILEEFWGRLQSFRNSSATTIEWILSENRPLKTKSGKGYERGGKGSQEVYGALNSTWKISAEPPAKKRPRKYFHVSGNASVRLRILSEIEGSSQKELAMWRMELGASDAPGCFFHAQILGRDPDPPFPCTLSVPRLPAIAFTPMAAMEFLIGELFQDDWQRHSARQTRAMREWTKLQSTRLCKLLEWKRSTVKDSAGSPWSALKSAKPKEDLFL